MRKGTAGNGSVNTPKWIGRDLAYSASAFVNLRFAFLTSAASSFGVLRAVARICHFHSREKHLRKSNTENVRSAAEVFRGRVYQQKFFVGVAMTIHVFTNSLAKDSRLEGHMMF